MKRLGRYTLLFERRPAILGHAAVCGKKEAAGPLARDFDQTFLDSYLNQESWEKAESMLQTEAANLAIRKAGLQKQEINMVFAGDLLNQCISSTFGLRGMDIPFLGQYGACSTMAQTLIMASIMVECGAAMAPAAAQTLLDYFNDTATKPEDYDRIYTGDLGAIGTKLLYELLRENGIVLRNHEDCGLILFDREAQDVHAGGSGCGCSAGVLCGHILNRMDRGELKNILFMATGALMSTTSSQQGESIPGIAHLVHVGRG